MLRYIIKQMKGMLLACLCILASMVSGEKVEDLVS
jgi:carboxypeptidase C (cathepsin A)